MVLEENPCEVLSWRSRHEEAWSSICLPAARCADLNTFAKELESLSKEVQEGLRGEKIKDVNINE